MIETICKDCGARYRLGTDHVCPKRPAKKSTAARMDVPKAPAPDRPMQGAGTQAPPVDTKFDKRSWMRDYMRDYRAKQKAAKNAV